MEVFPVKTWCSHMALLSPDNIFIPKPDTPCKRCRHTSGNWFCLYCKEIHCSASGNRHMGEHYEQTDHCLAIYCNSAFVPYNPLVRCFSCKATTCARQVIQRLQEKIEKHDSMMVNVTDLICARFPSFNINPSDAKPFDTQDYYALAKEGLQKIFGHGLEALSNDQLLKEFLTYSATLLSDDSCPQKLKADLSSFRDNLPNELSNFIQARNDLKVASDLEASIHHRKSVLQKKYYKYTNAKKELLASEVKIAHLKASLATEEEKKFKIDEALDSIATQVTSAKSALVLEIAQASGIEGTIQAANQLVSQQQSVWKSLKTTFTNFA